MKKIICIMLSVIAVGALFTMSAVGASSAGCSMGIHTDNNPIDGRCDWCLTFCSHTHEYDPVMLYDESSHWYECTYCGDKKDIESHYNTDGDGYCDSCGSTYTFAEHTCTYSIVSDLTHHWSECVCGETLNDVEAHYSTVDDGICDACGISIPSHTHEYDAVPLFNSAGHWYICGVCQYETTPEAHVGGEATCTQKAFCDVCGGAYGSLIPHTDNDLNAYCDVCGSALTGEGVKKLEYAIDKSLATALNVKVGDRLYFTTFKDDFDKLARYYYTALVPLSQQDYIHQQGLGYNGYSGGWYKFNVSYTDSGGQPLVLYDPRTENAYNKLELSVKFRKGGDVCGESVVSVVTHTYTNSLGTQTAILGFEFGELGTYDVTIQISFINESSSSAKVVEVTQNIVVGEADSSIKEAYDKGYLEGYKVGFENGKASDDEFTVYGFISAIAKAPSQFIDGMLDFDVFGINVASFVKMLFTLLLVVFVVVVIVRFVR